MTDWWNYDNKEIYSGDKGTLPSMQITKKEDLAKNLYYMLDSFTQQTNANVYHSQKIASLHIKSLKKESDCISFSKKFAVETVLESLNKYYYSRTAVSKPHSLNECGSDLVYFLNKNYVNPLQKCDYNDEISLIKKEINKIGEQIRKAAFENDKLTYKNPQKRSGISFVEEYYNAIPALEKMSELEDYYDLTIGNITAPLNFVDLQYIIKTRNGMERYITDLKKNQSAFDQELNAKNNKLFNEFNHEKSDEAMIKNARDFVLMFGNNDIDSLEKLSNISNPLDAIELAFEVAEKSSLDGIKENNSSIINTITSYDMYKINGKEKIAEAKEIINNKAEVQ